MSTFSCLKNKICCLGLYVPMLVVIKSTLSFIRTWRDGCQYMNTLKSRVIFSELIILCVKQDVVKPRFSLYFYKQKLNFYHPHPFLTLPRIFKNFRIFPHFLPNSAFKSQKTAQNHRIIQAQIQGFWAAKSRILGRKIKDFWPRFSGGTERKKRREREGEREMMEWE